MPFHIPIKVGVGCAMAGEHSPSLDQAVAVWVASDGSMMGQREMESTEVSERHLPKVFVTEMVVSMPELPGVGTVRGAEPTRWSRKSKGHHESTWLPKRRYWDQKGSQQRRR